MSPKAVEPRGTLREVIPTAQPETAEVAVVVASRESLPEALEQMYADGGPDVRSVMARLAADHKGSGLVDVAVDDDQWRQVTWVPLETPDDARAAGAHLAEGVTHESFLFTAPDEAATVDFLTGWLLGGYRFTMASTPPKGGAPMRVAVPDDVVDSVVVDASAVALARDLANTPANIKTPEWFVDTVTAALTGTDIEVSALDFEALESGGFGGIVAVGGGSVNPPRLLQLVLPGAEEGPTVALVGKGITFDSGGLSIKPADAMVTMKTDMSGAAAVVGAMLTLAHDRGKSADATIVALLPLAENMPSGSAYRPGDVVEHFGGRTTEVSNTDAEGRMVLADALVYAQQQHAPDVIVDLATLTGAAKLALSSEYAALFSNSDALAEQLLAAAERTGEIAWRMPLQPEYERFVDSVIADTTQSSTDPQARAGAITAALFLQRFIDDGVAWAHIDIAGPARSERNKGHVTAGGTGYGVRLIADWLSSGFTW